MSAVPFTIEELSTAPWASHGTNKVSQNRMLVLFFKENTKLQLSKHKNNHALSCLQVPYVVPYIPKHVIIDYSLLITSDD